MLPIKMELTEKVATTLRDLRLQYPVNGEILTAEKLSKAIGNNRAWMSQIESRRLKKIKREDIIAIYQLLHNEPDVKTAEKMAESDLLSSHITDIPHFADEAFSDGLVSLNNLISDLRDTLIKKYKNIENEDDRNTLLGCIESMIDNFENDYEHTKTIYTVPISYADPEYFGEDYAKVYYDSLDDVCRTYSIALSTAFRNADSLVFLRNYKSLYEELLDDINEINSTDHSGASYNTIFNIESFSSNIFYIFGKNKDTEFDSSETATELVILLKNLISSLFKKLKLDIPIIMDDSFVQKIYQMPAIAEAEVTAALMQCLRQLS